MRALRVYGDVFSGNCYKVLFACRHLGLAFDWHYIDILNGESRRAEFLERSPIGRIPVLELPDGRHLAESNAILNYLASGTTLMPEATWSQAKVLQWQFYEQYEHEPCFAVARYIKRYLGLPEARRDEFLRLQERAQQILGVLETHLENHPFFVDERFSIADISLHAYTHRAHEADIDLSPFPAIQAWLQRVSEQAGYISMETAAAELGQS